MTEHVSRRYQQYLLAVLLFILAFNFMDRYALGVLLQDIKVDLALTDTQLGFMSGIAFALFYAIMGLPIARWADRGNRVTIITLTTVLWSVMVALCGLAGSFVQLLLIRVGVAVGEAGCLPSASSLLADYFNRAARARAWAIYSLGASLGLMTGYLGAGWLNELYGWRMTFIVLGSPGVLMAVLAWSTLREPRALHAKTPAETPSQPTLRAVFATLSSNVTFRHLVLGLAVIYFFLFGIVQWQPAFFIRSHGFTSTQLGIWFAAIYGASGMLGGYLGGTWASRRARHNERAQLATAAIIYTGLSAVSPFTYLIPSAYGAFVLMGIVNFGLTTINGPIVAIVQTLVPERMRAMAAAVMFLFANLLGLGLGPLTVGALSDAFRAWAGEESLRYALLVMSPGYVWAAWHFWRASRTVVRDIEATHRSLPAAHQHPHALEKHRYAESS